MADRDYTIVGPDGRELTITGPANATAEQLRSAAERAFGAQPAQPKQSTKPTFGQMFKDELLTSLPGGLVRGAKDVIDTGAGFLSRLGGNEESERVRLANQSGKDEFTAAQGRVGAGGSNITRVGGQILGAAPVVSALGAAAGASGMSQLGTAISSFGARGGNLFTKTLGGGISGGVSAGLADPKDAASGAAISAALPGVLKVSGIAGNVLGRALRGPEQSPQMRNAIMAAQELGLVIPPTQAKASIGNRLLEGTAGKLTTAQNASVKNSAKVKEIAAQALGLPPDTQLTPEVLGQVKKAAGVLYDAVSNAGVVTPGKAYTAALDDIAAPHMKAMAGFPNAKPSPVLGMIDSLRSEAFDAASAVAKIKELRSAADDAFKPGGQGADIGRAAKKAAKALEDALDEHLQKIGEPDLLEQFRNARTLYAKTMTVDKALDKASGTVDARKLAAELQKGKPLSGDLRKVAEAAGQFKTAFKTPEQMGSLPQFSPLDLYGSAGLAGIGGAVTGNPLSALALGLPLLRTSARNAALSPRVQAGLVQRPTNPLRLISPGVEQFGYRAAPVIAADQ